MVAGVVQIREEYRKRRSTSSSRQPGRHVLGNRIAGLKQENDDLNRAMFEAAQVQRRLCGHRYFRTGLYEFASEIFPLRHLSGDFITVTQAERDLVFVIGDIAGKGLMAGMWFTHMVGMIRREISVHRSPAAALTAVDRSFLLTGIEFPLTTLFLARLDLSSGEMTYCNAGHPPVLLIRDNREVEELSQGGPVLGVRTGERFEDGNIRLNGSDTLLAYSDGIAECRNESGIEFGAERLLNAAKTFSNLSANDMLFSVLASAENFLGRHHREDDIALLVLRRHPNSEIERWERPCLRPTKLVA
jgi:sigma-B regulation protein RsbU (phosphoserine phosphatase)